MKKKKISAKKVNNIIYIVSKDGFTEMDGEHILIKTKNTISVTTPEEYKCWSTKTNKLMWSIKY